jgi:hypothetical protein
MRIVIVSGVHRVTRLIKISRVHRVTRLIKISRVSGVNIYLSKSIWIVM